MVRAPQRTPTVQELAERVSRLEKQMAEMVKTLAHSDTSTVHEMTELRHALLGGRDELIPFPHHIERTIYGKDVMDLTIFGLRSM
jgi:hypothetical protein